MPVWAGDFRKRSEAINWPLCAICTARNGDKGVPVKAYARVHETDTHLVYATECDHGHAGHRSEQEHRIEKPSLGVGQADGSHWRRDAVREQVRHTKP